jgi:TolB-like protein/tetratricopeptide (TPR) repeat protein
MLASMAWDGPAIKPIRMGDEVLGDTSLAGLGLEPFSLLGVRVDPSSMRLSSPQGENVVEPKVMSLLVVLVRRPGELWLRSALIDQLWPGDSGSDQSLTRAVSHLRKALTTPHGIGEALVTVPKLGYRLDATIQRHGDTSDGKTRIAVLPFRSLSRLGDQGYFADGIADELITRLGSVPQLRVTGRTSVFQFRDSDMDMPQIAEKLRVTHLVEGSVQHQHDDVRIDVRLIDGKTGFEMWSYRYDGKIDDIFASRDEVAHDATIGLSEALDLPEPQPKNRKMSDNKAAYDLYLQGRALTNRTFGNGALAKAVELFQEALELDPDFSECWTVLAEAHVYTVVDTPCLDRHSEARKMASCARRAIELDQMQGHARAMLELYQWTRNDIVGALDLAYEAHRLEPDNPDVTIRLGSFLLYCGLTTEALPLIQRAIDQDPVHGRNYGMLCVAHMNLGNLEASIAAGQRMTDLGYPAMFLAVALATLGDRDLAVQRYHQTRLLLNTVIFPPVGSAPLEPEAMDAYWLIAAKGVCSDRAEDRALYGQLLEMLHATLHDPGDPSIVMPAIWMGNAQLVFKTLGQDITPANMICFMMIWADVDPIRQVWQHPDFLAFADRTGLVAAWEKYGWPDLLPGPLGVVSQCVSNGQGVPSR